MIVSAGIAATARARALTPDKVERLHAAWVEAQNTNDPLVRVMDIIEEISQGCFWAGLLDSIEYRMWEMLSETNLRNLDLGQLSVKEVRTLLAEVKALTVDDPAGGWWFVFDLDHTALGYRVARQVTLTEWEAMPPRAPRVFVLVPPTRP